MDTQQLEHLTKSAQCAELLVSDLRETLSAVCSTEPALAILLRDLIRDASSVKQRLEELEACYR